MTAAEQSTSQLGRAGALLLQCMTRDRRRLTNWFQVLEKDRAQGRLNPQAVARLTEDLARSNAQYIQRSQSRPTITYPEDLPISQHRVGISDCIHANPVTIICGETGSGKTTQLAKICLELGRGVAGFIGHTQPRRLAARTVAQRIASELGTPIGQAVGYKVRFSDHTSPQAYLKLMTDGILLAETQSDPLLEAYDTIIIDEAHERSLNIDFLLGYLKRIMPKRPDLKLIITSATIDPERFSVHFDDAPIIQVSGRTYPVEVMHQPLESDDPDEEDSEQIDGILRAVDTLVRQGPGDVLIFLSGEREIRETAEALRGTQSPATQILPLYARLSADEQNRVFQSHATRRIVLATNVAETSVTVPCIRYVIDPGTARLSRYSPKHKVQRLPIEPISQASANQRKGRCGRLGPGLCIRLYSEADFASRPLFTEPEILRTNLAGVILQMKALNLGSPEDFPFLSPPDRRAIRDGYQTLHELGAVDERRVLTGLGRDMARLPVDPRMARMLISARAEGCVNEVLVIAAALSASDPRDRPADQQQAADEAHRRLADPRSDFLTYLNIWSIYHAKVRELSRGQLRKWCRSRFLSYLRLREWVEVHRQLKLLIAQSSRADERAKGPR